MSKDEMLIFVCPKDIKKKKRIAYSLVIVRGKSVLIILL